MYDFGLRKRYETAKSITRFSLRLLVNNRRLFVYPVLSVAGVLILFALAFASPAADKLEKEELDYFWIAVFMFGIYAVAVFCNAALVHAVDRVLHRQPQSIGASFLAAARHLPKLLFWVLISTIVGVIADRFRSQRGTIPAVGFLAFLGSLAWGLATYFVVPLIMLENLSVVRAMKASVQLFKKTWGSTVVGRYGLGYFFAVIGTIVAVLTFIVCLGLVFLLNSLPPSPLDHLRILILLAVPLVVFVVFVVATAVSQVFAVALYHYAQHDNIAPGLSPVLIKQAFFTERRRAST